MPKTTVAGHSLHAIINDLPLVLLPTSLAFDAAYLITRKQKYADAANATLVAGYISGLAAGITGAADYVDLPNEQPLKATADLHMLLNLGLLGLTGVNIWLRRGRKPPTGFLPVTLSLVSNAAMFYSGWLGGHMVFEHGVRVKGVDPTEGAAEMRMPGDNRLVSLLKRWVTSFAALTGSSRRGSMPDRQ